MKDPVRIELKPLGESFEVERGTPLVDCLFPYGVEFPCGGRGRCKGCRIKVLDGALPVAPAEENVLTAVEIAEGWRLACRARAEGNLTLEVAQWETDILADSSTFEFTPGRGLGITLDLGTTTIAGQLLDLKSGNVLAVKTALNSQARHGGDVMTRVQFAVTGDGLRELRELIRRELGSVANYLLKTAQADPCEVREIVIVGNTVMHHLFCGIDVTPLSHYPFETPRGILRDFTPTELGWNLGGAPRVHFLPCLGSFVGSDILAGILATRMHENPGLTALVDLGTNGEIVVGNKERLLCTSTAAGPAFEGARISMGMRAATGAVARVSRSANGIRCRVLGDEKPRGLCGSGLVDLVAAGLDIGKIQSSGRFQDGSDAWKFCPPVTLTQTDVRELQLAKGAIAAGLRILLRQWGASRDDLEAVYLAGAFGNYINRTSARRIGLLDLPEEKVLAAGNTALLGAKVALFHWDHHPEAFAAIEEKTRHVSLSSDEQFQETYVESMLFPA